MGAGGRLRPYNRWPRAGGQASLEGQIWTDSASKCPDYFGKPPAGGEYLPVINLWIFCLSVKSNPIQGLRET